MHAGLELVERFTQQSAIGQHPAETLLENGTLLGDARFVGLALGPPLELAARLPVRVNRVAEPSLRPKHLGQKRVGVEQTQWVVHRDHEGESLPGHLLQLAKADALFANQSERHQRVRAVLLRQHLRGTELVERGRQALQGIERAAAPPLSGTTREF